MKVLLLNDYATPQGGAEILTLALREELRRRGHDARLLSTTAGADDGGAADYSCRGTTGRWRTLLRTTNPWAARTLRRVLREFEPDVVHVRMFLSQLSPSILPLLRGVPAVGHVVWFDAVCPTGTKLLPDGSRCAHRAGLACLRHCLPAHDFAALMVQRRLLRARWRRAFDVTVANSGHVASRLREDGLPADLVIPNGVPERPARPGLAPDPTVVFAGRLVREKGAHVLLRAFALVRDEVPDARLLIAGDGPESAALRALAAELGIDGAVRFLGHLSHDELEQQLSGAWVQAVPSVWAEPFGLSVAEAMMRGIAVVASATGGPAETVVHGRTGLLVTPGDHRALATALASLLTDPEAVVRVGRAGRERALQQFSQRAFVDAVLEAYARARTVATG